MTAGQMSFKMRLGLFLLLAAILTLVYLSNAPGA
jgi:hypothetical protein